MRETTEQRITIEQTGGPRLEGATRPSDGAISAVVMHPHPQYGGDMDNHVVMALCAALRGAGATTLRFNFRGTGCSEGAYDGGRGEEDDARAAITWLRTERPQDALLIAGYSFGAMVATAIADEFPAAGVVLVSPPIGYSEMRFPNARTLIVTGARDPIAPAEKLRELKDDTTRVVIVSEADHGWWPGVDALTDEVALFAQSLVAR
jgi:alpha/beta superfamily hydrolase